jgi:hypothetical protein
MEQVQIFSTLLAKGKLSPATKMGTLQRAINVWLEEHKGIVVNRVIQSGSTTNNLTISIFYEKKAGRKKQLPRK